MSITVRKYSAQVKDPSTGNMIPAGLLSSDALGAIDAAKTSAVSAIEAKGVETRASIPNDYTVLANDITGLKNAVTQDTVLSDSYWQRKSLASATGNASDSTTRISTIDYIPKEFCFVYPKNGYAIGIYAWDNTDSYVGVWDGNAWVTTGVTWHTSEIAISNLPGDYNIKIIARSSAGTSVTITLAESSNIVFKSNELTGLKNALVLQPSYVLQLDSDWKQGTLAKTGSYTDRARCIDSTTRLVCAQRYPISVGETFHFMCPIGAKYRVFFATNTGTINYDTTYTFVVDGRDDLTVWHTDDRSLTVPEGAIGLLICIAFVDDSAITVQTRPNVAIYRETLGTTVTENKLRIDALTKQLPSRTKLNITWENGYVNPNGSSTIVSSTTRCCLPEARAIGEFTSEHRIYIECPDEMKCRLTFWSSESYSTSNVIPTEYNSNWHSRSLSSTIPTNAKVFAVSLAYIDDSSISPEDCSSVNIYIVYNGYSSLEYDGKVISILGDSISTFDGYSYPGNRTRYPQSNLLTDVDDTYWMRLINGLGMTLGINESWAGSLVSNTASTDSGDVGPNRYIASPTRIGHLGENGTPDIILVNAGTNDIGTAADIGVFNTENPMNYTAEQIANLPVATFADGYRAMLIRLQKSYPTSMIVCLLPNYTTSYYTPTEADSYCEIIKEACDYFGVRWYDMRTCGITIFNRATYLPDGIHPNAEGMKLMFEKLKKDFLYDLTTY